MIHEFYQMYHKCINIQMDYVIMIEKMKHTPSGWGEGYRNIDMVSCLVVPRGMRPTPNQYIKCSLIPEEGKEAELYGSEVQFEDIDSVEYDSGVTAYSSNGKMACYVDAGIIKCYKEGEENEFSR